jgi:hypothetical protein
MTLYCWRYSQLILYNIINNPGTFQSKGIVLAYAWCDREIRTLVVDVNPEDSMFSGWGQLDTAM